MFGRGFCGERCEYEFVHEYERFRVEPGSLKRIEGSKLKSMFVPKLTREGVRALGNRHFVASQLMHYGIEVDEKDFKGRGTALLKKALQAGQCDQVPDRVVQVKEQMHMDWLKTCTIDELISDPAWIMDKHFLRGGLPDRTKTTIVVGVPLPRSSQYRAQCVIEAASKVPGLNHRKVLGFDTQMIYIGWDAAAEEEIDLAGERERKRAKLHANYLNAFNRRKSKTPNVDASPVGSYIVDCEYMTETWGDDAENLLVDIDKTDTPGVFQAKFDFGIFEGIMMIGLQKDILEQYCLEVDRRTVFSEDDSDSEARTIASGAKRKAPGSHNAKKPKKQHTRNTQPRKYFLKIRCRETGSSQIQTGTETAQSTDIKHMATFRGATVLHGWGAGITFAGRKVSDVPFSSEKNWAMYSERRDEYEWARRRRR